MHLTISREVIQSIKFARDFQLAKDPDTPDKAALAKLGFNNGHRAELILNIKKLSAWARTFKADQVPNGFNTAIEEADSHYAGSLMLRADLGNEFSSLLRLHAGGLVFADPIEIEIKGGIAQIVAAPGGETELKAIRAAARLESGKQRNAKEANKIKRNLCLSQASLKHGQRKHEEAVAWLTEHSLETAITEAKTLRDEQRTVCRINRIIDALVTHIRPEGFRDMKKKERMEVLDILQNEISIEAEEIKRELLALGTLQSSETTQYDLRREELIKALYKRNSFCPQSWKSTGLEQRNKAVRIAHQNLRYAANLYKATVGYRQADSYQAHRVTVRRWPRERTSLESEIAGFEQELVLKQEQLTRLENPVKPVKTPKAKKQPVSNQPVPGIQDSHGETMSKTAEQLDLIERIIQAARKPVPKIVESHHGDGYVFQDPDGTRYGVREATEQELTDRFNAGQDADMQRFREDLTDYSDDCLQSQADYWLGAHSQPEPTPVPQQTGETIMPTETITLTFTKEKETKNTIKFEEDERDGQPKIVGSLYLQKFVAKSRDKITVTIV